MMRSFTPKESSTVNRQPRRLVLEIYS